MSAHLQGDDRDRQNEADPEPPRHVDQLGVGAACFGKLRLERHAADRAMTGADLAHFGMHGTGVDRARGNRRLGWLGGPGLMSMAMSAVMVLFERDGFGHGVRLSCPCGLELY